MLDKRLGLHAHDNPGGIAVRLAPGPSARVWTNEQVWRQARSAAARLRELGVAPGDRVALCAENSPEWILAYLGIYLAGAVVVPLDAQFSERELSTILGFAGCRLVVCSRTKRSAAARFSPGVVILDDEEASLFSGPPLDPVPSRGSEELMAVHFTSGTTGEPKGVCLTVGNIMSNLESLLRLNYIACSDVVLCLLPLHHCYALTTSVLVPLAAGASITVCTSLQGPDILAAMQATGVSIVMGVPKLFEGFDRAILDKVGHGSRFKQRAFYGLLKVSRIIRRTTGRNPGRRLFPAVHRAFGPRFRFFVSGGAKLDAEITERFLDLGLPIVEGYGLTETAPVVALNPLDDIHPGTVGRPLPGVEVRIEQPKAEGVGQIIVRGPNVMKGYDRREEESANVLRDGWFHTGDLGRIDSEGYLHITGRLKEVIVLPSGKNVYPEDVERHYEKSALIKELCVMPIERGDGRVDRLCALVVPAFDELRRIRATSTVEALHKEITHLSQSLPSYMRVTDLKIVTNELPRTRLGKLRRAEIRGLVLNEVVEARAAVSPQDQALLAVPGADGLIARLRAVSGFQGEIVPSLNLELDLGIDSLDRIELDVVLEKEFNVKIPAEETADIVTVGDLLRRLVADHRADVTPEGWKEILAQPVSPPLAAVFSLPPGFGERRFVAGLRRLALGLSKWLFPLDIRGLENVPADRPFLLCPSHSSLIDSVLVFLSLPDAVRDRTFFLGAAEFFESFVMRRVARMGRVIPTATTDTVLTSLRRAAEAIRMGGAVCIFPEGYITRDGFLQPPRPGAGILACELGVPVVPVLVRGTYDVLSYTHPGFRFCPVGLTFGPAIDPPAASATGNFTSEQYASVMAAWERAMAELRAQDDASGSRTAGRSPRIRENPARG